MWGPSVRSIPLQPGIDEGRWVGAVVPSKRHVYAGEEAKGVGRTRDELVWDDTDPEWVECGNREEAVA